MCTQSQGGRRGGFPLKNRLYCRVGSYSHSYEFHGRTQNCVPIKQGVYEYMGLFYVRGFVQCWVMKKSMCHASYST